MSDPANPFRFWISGNETKEFSFLPSSKALPHYVAIHEEMYQMMSVVLWVTDKADAVFVLQEAHHFMLMCAISYRKANEGRPDAFLHVHSHEQHANKWRRMLELVEAGDFTCEPLNTGKAIKVAWAINDTI